MANIHDEIKRLGEEIEAAKNAFARLEGKELEIVRQANEKFKVNTLPALEKILGEITAKRANLATKIKEKFDKLKEVYEW